jgi:serine/threonine-protein kinase
MPLTPGARVGPYEVMASLGAGGMGEVYRARDTKLGREVAIKTLPPLFAADAERLARMKREAQLLASLNHPNIAQVYGFEDASASHGSPALVMELVPGVDLAARIAAGAIPLPEALPIAQQIAAALEAAHEAGVIHRDLKPANVKVTDDGTVKVLDFGLAKALSPEDASSASNATNSPTLTARATQMGVVLGTAAYMAPEQAKGRPVDRRADLWAFGVVLFEMLAGRRAFEGADVTEILAAVIRDAPALDRLPPDTPASIRRLLRRCLQKDRRDRLADASTARLEIADAIAGDAAGASGAPVPPVSSGRSRAAWLGAVVAVGAIAAAAAWMLKPAPPASRALVSRFSVGLPPNSNWTRQTNHILAISNDGTRLAYVADSQLRLRRLDQIESTTIATVRDPQEVFFSFDGESVGFFAEGKLQRVPVEGGTPSTICPTTTVTGASWGSDDWIVFSTAASILRVRASGGTPETTAIDRTTSERFGSPRLLNNGTMMLFSLSPAGTTWEDGEIVVQDLRTRARTVLVKGATDPRYLSAGFLIYGRGSDLFAVRFDAQKGALIGEPATVVNGVAAAIGSIGGAYQYAVSENGTFAYVPGSAVADMQLAWVDRSGRETPIVKMPGALYPRVSPDGNRLAFAAVESGNMDVYVRERDRNAQNRLTFDTARDTSPVWTPDSKRVVYASSRGGSQNIYWQSADGTGTAERLTTNPNDQWPYAITPDGKTLLYIELAAATTYDIYSMPLEGDRTPKGLLVRPFDERRPSLSPDGKWMVYQSNESGPFELFVRPFPNIDGGRWQLSTGGGSSPIWSPNGNEIVYRQEQKLMRVDVKTSPAFSAGTPTQVASIQLATDSAGMAYGLADNGRQFLIVRPTVGSSGPIEYRVVLNWLEEVRAKMRSPK